MLVSDFIRENGLETLVATRAIKVRDYDNYVILNYNQIESRPKTDEIICECRSLILEKESWNPIACGFDRFFNHGETDASKNFPISKATTSKKIDGSLLLLWFDPFDNVWRASTRGMAHAEGEVREGLITFAQLVEKTLGQSVNDLMTSRNADKNLTYICELATPENRVVTPYTDYKIYLLSIRNPKTGLELTDEESDAWAFELGLSRPQRFHFDSWDSVIESARNLPAMDEGYVCYVRLEDDSVFRVKCKNPAFVAIAHLRDSGLIGGKRMAVLVLSNDEEEYLSYFPEDHEYFDSLIEARNEMLSFIDNLWKKTKDIEDQKTFALEVKDTPVAAVMFSLRKGMELSDIFAKMPDDGKFRLLSKFAKISALPPENRAPAE